MAIKQYIGARYVPIMFGDWDSKVAYSPLTIVIYKNNSYTSKKYVPVGIDIGDTNYWAMTGNFNGQINENTTKIADLTTRIENLEKYPSYSAVDETVTFSNAAREASTKNTSDISTTKGANVTYDSANSALVITHN